MRTWHVISIIVENKPQAHQKVHLHTIKVYNTRPESLLIKISFSTTEVFTCSKVINSFKRQSSWTDPFRKSSKSHLLIFPKLSSQNTGGFGHATILILSFHALLCPKYKGTRLADYLAAYASETNKSSLRHFSSHRLDALSASLPTSHHRLNRQPR